MKEQRLIFFHILNILSTNSTLSEFSVFYLFMQYFYIFSYIYTHSQMSLAYIIGYNLCFLYPIIKVPHNEIKKDSVKQM